MKRGIVLIQMNDEFAPWICALTLTWAECPFYDEVCVAGRMPTHAPADYDLRKMKSNALSAMIIVKDLTKRYAHAVAVDQISFSVTKGQIVGFLGPNGAGKTTTMRILTCFLSPSSGSAEVAGFNVLEQPLEVKRRIGYLPENPPLYPEMETGEYLRFVGKLKGIPSSDLEERVDYVCRRCFVADVKNKLLGKLSKGYRQRVGLAQAIIHNPDVLILDEPTAGLDPKQINETRDLIKSLAGDHTIILSTHILPEVEQICEQVIIINKGKVVATDSVRNLQARTRGDELLLVEIAGQPDATLIQQKLEAIPGVSRVQAQHSQGTGARFEVQSEKGELVRGDLARTIVAAGWDLNELRPAAKSLEEVFLQLTGTAPAAELGSQPASEPEPAQEAGREPEPDAEKDQL
jgi:ABC-2 type transport system ATP-binding protein